ncbi:MAG: hypothetical protein PVI43_00890 [Candidatus Bathyarchaeota archaeon]|jgi:hypothetical protein
MGRPRKNPLPENKQDTETKANDPTNDLLAEMQKKIQLLEQEKDQLNRKLEKRHQTPQDEKTLQYQQDIRGIEEMRQEDARKVKGIFRCLQPAGGNVEFYFRKWKGDPIEKYTLHDGQEYELPISVVKHLNEQCYEEDKAYLLDANGEKIRGAGKKRYRFSFTVSNYGTPVKEDVQSAVHCA